MMNTPPAMHSFGPQSGKPSDKSDLELAALDPQRVEALKDRLSRVRTALTVWVPFFGHLLLKLDPHIATASMGIPTMAVSRDRRLFLNLDFCDKLTDAEFAAVLCHEVMHPAYLCWERQGTRVAVVESQWGDRVLLWNIAHDYAINGIIDTMCKDVSEVSLPSGGCLDHRYDEHAAEEIYDIILKQACKGGGDGEGTIRLPGKNKDDHWGTDDMRDDLGGDGKQSGGDGEGEDGDGEGGGLEGDGLGPQTSGQSRGEAQNRSLDQYWKVALCEAAQVHEKQKGRGTLPGALQKLIDEITDPKISWIDVLSRWVGANGRRADFTYRRPSRRSESIGEFLPALQRHGVDDLVVLWDTSGSMNGREAEILSETIGICDDLNMSLRVICCDAAIHSDQEDVREPEDVDVKGGGGSDFTPAFNKLHEEGYTGVVVAYTDGYIGVPAVKPTHIRDVLWVLWEAEGDVDPTGGKWGQVLRVDGDGNEV